MSATTATARNTGSRNARRTATARNTGSRNARRTATTTRRATVQRLSQRGVGAVAVTVAVLVLLAGHGHAFHASLAGTVLYLLVNGCHGPVAGSGRYARQALRTLAWVVVAVALLSAAQGSTAPGGPLLGVALAAALATALRLTARRRRS